MKKTFLLILCAFLGGCTANNIAGANCDIGSSSFFGYDEKGTAAINGEKAERTIIVDMYESGHFVAGNSIVEWHGNSIHNRTIQEIDGIEKEMIASLNNEISVFTDKNGIASEPEALLKTEDAMTLKDYAEKNGYEYLRVPCKAGEWPSAVKVETLIKYFNGISGNAAMTCTGNELKLGDDISVILVGNERSINSAICILTLLEHPEYQYKDIESVLYLDEDGNLPEKEKVSYMAQLLVNYFNANSSNDYHTSFNDWLLTHSDN